MQAIKQPPPPSEPTTSAIAVPPNEAARMAGIGRTTLYAAMAGGGLKSIKIGKRRLIAVDALREWLLAHEVRQ